MSVVAADHQNGDDSIVESHKYSVLLCVADEKIKTRSSATAKSTARPSCLVGVLYDIYRETNNRSTANQPLVPN